MNDQPASRSKGDTARLLEAACRLLDIQDRERRLIAYEIHDGLTQYLAGAHMHLQASEAAIGDCPAAVDLREGIRLVAAAAAESRRLIEGSRLSLVDDLGVVPAIESLIINGHDQGPRVRFHSDLPGPRLLAAIEATIFRIVQESLANARNHAGADMVTIELSRTSSAVRIRVTDDGHGFDPADVSEDRFGLEGIRQRATLFGGEACIQSAPGQGTTIDVVLPVLSALQS